MAVNRGRRAKAKSVVAPVGGLNDRDSIADMGVTYATQLDNWFPGTQSVSVRGGSIEHANGMSTTGETLLAYNGVGSKKLFAAAGGNIYDVTAGGTLVGTVVSGKSNARWDYVNFANNGASYIACVNGTDLPMFYNGSAWTPSGTGYATAITGTDASKFTQVSAWKNRLFFVQKNSLSCWYLGTGAIGGAASELNFGGVAKLGGKLVATATITTSAGVTIDDYFCAITSEGECLVYRGTDPSSSTTFGLVGNYRIGRPIANGSDNMGGRFLSKYGADIVAITADGFSTLQGMMNADVVAQNRTINDIIINTVTSSVSSYADNFGWQALLAPMQNKLIINVPTADSVSSFQYVMNTITGAWTKFVGWNATCFEYFDDEIYCIIGDKVLRVDQDGQNDFMTSTSQGTVITAVAKTSFIYFGGRGELKSFKMARPLLIAGGSLQPLVNINVNLNDQPIVGTVEVSSTNAAGRWNRSKWQVGSTPAKWGGGEVMFQDWISVSGLGYCAALKMLVQTDTNRCKWQGWDMMYENGGLI